MPGKTRFHRQLPPPNPLRKDLCAERLIIKQGAQTMLNENTVTKLNEMKLGVMSKTFRSQLSESKYNDLLFEERFGIIVDAEWAARKSNRLTRLIKNAGYDFPGAQTEDIEYHADRKLDKAMIARLAACSYIEERHNIIIMGATGNGKTYISNAFGTAANRNFYTANMCGCRKCWANWL